MGAARCGVSMPAIMIGKLWGEADMASGTADEPSKTEVLIIGAGPAGLFAASELLRYGVRPRIVEQRSAPHHETRGTGLQPAVLEVLHRAGMIEPFLADSARVSE